MMRDTDDVHDDEVRQAARRLGAAAADRLDVERTAEAVLTRLRAGDAPAPAPIRWLQPAWMRAAAVVVVIIGGGLAVLHRLNVPDPDRMRPQPAGIFAGIDSSELQNVIADLEEPIELTSTVHGGEPGVEDLSEPQLVSLLKEMED